jgi:hypothetical protein
MNIQSIKRLLGLTLMLLVVGCALFSSKGQIVVQVVSWPLVKQLAEPAAGLAGQTVTVQTVEDHRLIAEKTTGTSGILIFEVPAGHYIVHGIGNQAQMVTVESGQAVNLKLIEH